MFLANRCQELIYTKNHFKSKCQTEKIVPYFPKWNFILHSQHQRFIQQNQESHITHINIPQCFNLRSKVSNYDETWLCGTLSVTLSVQTTLFQKIISKSVHSMIWCIILGWCRYGKENKISERLNLCKYTDFDTATKVSLLTNSWIIKRFLVNKPCWSDYLKFAAKSAFTSLA